MATVPQYNAFAEFATEPAVSTAREQRTLIDSCSNSAMFFAWHDTSRYVATQTRQQLLDAALQALGESASDEALRQQITARIPSLEALRTIAIPPPAEWLAENWDE